MIVVSNSSPLIALASIGRFSLLQRLFEKIVIPEAVQKEVVQEGKIGASLVAKASWIQVIPVKNHTGVQKMLQTIKIHPGESEAISLGLETKADLIILDDKKARRYAGKIGLPVIGTIGLLLAAQEKQFIKNIHQEIDQLKSNNFHISDSFYQKIIKSN